MGEGPAPYTVNELTVSYVVLLESQGTVNINIQPEALSQVFGSLGPAHFSGLPNGYVVQAGQSNQLLFQPPRVIFKCANENLLLEMYQNAREMVLGQFNTRTARAFGVNFELNVVFAERPRQDVFQQLRPRLLHDITQL